MPNLVSSGYLTRKVGRQRRIDLQEGAESIHQISFFTASIERQDFKRSVTTLKIKLDVQKFWMRFIHRTNGLSKGIWRYGQCMYLSIHVSRIERSKYLKTKQKVFSD